VNSVQTSAVREAFGVLPVVLFAEAPALLDRQARRVRMGNKDSRVRKGRKVPRVRGVLRVRREPMRSASTALR
jgi:hypothetical protein